MMLWRALVISGAEMTHSKSAEILLFQANHIAYNITFNSIIAY